MTGETIKTLAEYIVKLNKNREQREKFEEYSGHQFDSNGVEIDKIQDLNSSNTSSGASQ